MGLLVLCAPLSDSLIIQTVISSSIITPVTPVTPQPYNSEQLWLIKCRWLISITHLRACSIIFIISVFLNSYLSTSGHFNHSPGYSYILFSCILVIAPIVERWLRETENDLRVSTEKLCHYVLSQVVVSLYIISTFTISSQWILLSENFP